MRRKGTMSAQRSAMPNAAVLCFAFLLALPNLALAYATGSAATLACHETMTLSAIADVGWPGDREPPPNETVERVGGFLPARVPEAQRDSWTVPLIIGVRHPDFRDASPSDFVALAAVHAVDPAQSDHCLRQRNMDGLEGNAEAIAACRDFIVNQVAQATGAGEEVNLSAVEKVDVWLDYGRSTELTVNSFAYHMGIALHALQDSFTHTLRTPDGHRVLAVLNYVEIVDGSYDEERDGYEHSSNLDDCELDTEYTDRRVLQALQASRDLLVAVKSGTNTERTAAVRAVLDDWLVYMDMGCTASNDYCDNEALAQPTAGCAATAADGSAAVGALFMLAGLLMVFRRRPSVVVGVLALCVSLGAADAFAQAGAPPAAPPPMEGDRAATPTDPPRVRTRTEEGEEVVTPTNRRANETAEEGSNEQAVDPNRPSETGDSDVDGAVTAAQASGDTVVSVDTEEDELTVIQERRIESDGGSPINQGFGMALSIFGGFDDEVLGVSLGLRSQIGDHFILGVDGEYQKWFSIETSNASRGVANVYLTGIVVWTALGPVEIRSNIHAGISVLLFDYPSADKGSIGPFFGITPLALGIRVHRSLRVTIDPGGIFFEVPALTGVPLAHRHHRFAVGLQWTP